MTLTVELALGIWIGKILTVLMIMVFSIILGLLNE